MQIQKRTVSGITILDLNGKLVLGVGDYVLRMAVREALEAGQKKILLHMAAVTYVDSSGLGEMISSYTTTSNQGGKLKLLRPTQKLNDLLMITKLITVFEVYEDEAEAVKSFA